MRAAAVVLAALAVAGIVFQIFRSGPSDQEAITEAVLQAAQASREGQPGGVMERLSRSLTYNGVPVSERGELARFIQESKPNVVFDTTQATIQGETAVIRTGARVDLRLGPAPVSQRLENVTIVLAKETGFRWLVLPTPKWRVVSVQAEEAGASALNH
jgi:hypothetical protein